MKAQAGVRPATCRPELGLQLVIAVGQRGLGTPDSLLYCLQRGVPQNRPPAPESPGRLLKCGFLGSLPYPQQLHLSQALEEAGACEPGSRTSSSAVG